MIQTNIYMKQQNSQTAEFFITDNISWKQRRNYEHKKLATAPMSPVVPELLPTCIFEYTPH